MMACSYDTLIVIRGPRFFSALLYNLYVHEKKGMLQGQRYGVICKVDQF